jgi:hypothetical protein
MILSFTNNFFAPGLDTIKLARPKPTSSLLPSLGFSSMLLAAARTSELSVSSKRRLGYIFKKRSGCGALTIYPYMNKKLFTCFYPAPYRFRLKQCFYDRTTFEQANSENFASSASINFSRCSISSVNRSLLNKYNSTAFCFGSSPISTAKVCFA